MALTQFGDQNITFVTDPYPIVNVKLTRKKGGYSQAYAFSALEAHQF